MIKVSYDSAKFTDIDELEKYYYKKINSTNFSVSRIKSKFKFSSKKELPIKIIFRFLKFYDDAFRIVFLGYSLKSILLKKAEDIPSVIVDLEQRISSLNVFKRHNFIKKLKVLFDYKDKYQNNIITPFFKDNFDYRVCHFCNRSYITNYTEANGDKKSTFQLDHFYEKTHYPYLALSLYNFIPCCSTCNSTVKNSAINNKDNDCFAKKCIAPNRKDFDFDEKVKFKSFFRSERASFTSKDDIKSLLIEKLGNKKYENYIDLFLLNERYESHSDLRFDMIKMREEYPDTRIKELSMFLHKTEAEIKHDLFGKYLYEDISKQPLSKFMKDLYIELGLI